MPITDHPCFARPLSKTPLWRYIDLPKFLALVVNNSLWLSNVEVLALDDPHEGTLSSLQFYHRQFSSIDQLPIPVYNQVVNKYRSRGDGSIESCFEEYIKEMEQINIISEFSRRSYYVNCWHAADHESVAMWKIYASPGPGLAIVSSGDRIRNAISCDERELHLGKVSYFDERVSQIDYTNGFNLIMSKRVSFSFENEVRLVYFDASSRHVYLDRSSWNRKTLRFDKVIDYPTQADVGINLSCDVGYLIDEIVISPYAPAWYEGLINNIKTTIGCSFPVRKSQLLKTPLDRRV